MKLAFASPTLPTTGAVVVGMTYERKLTETAKLLDRKMSGGLMRAIKASRCKGAKGETLTLLAPSGTKLDRVVVVGMGKAAEIDEQAALDMGGHVVGAVRGKVSGDVHFVIDSPEGCTLEIEALAAQIAFGATLRSYSFDKYKTKEKKEKKPEVKTLRILCDKSPRARAAYQSLYKVAEGVFFTRDLVSEPANILTPPEFAARIKKELTKVGVKVSVLGEKEMKKLGMGALLGVGQGSEQESKLVVMEWHGGPKKTGGKAAGKSSGKSEGPVAFIGKGVCFDTGGISIKPSGGMEDMKWDMGGAGVVVGLMKALAGRKAKVNAVGVVGLVENMPSGSAQRPGDIVTSASGQTIEVLNTDAEGRLVLADALWYVQDKFKPKLMVDLATLTGAIIIALGEEYCGLFSNNDKLADQLTQAGKDTGEGAWRLPMGDAYDKLINSDAADMKNISGGRGGGSITAAQFLQRFVEGKTPWAHLDIAGTTWSKKDTATVPKGGTGFGVRLLDRFVRDHYEGK